VKKIQQEKKVEELVDKELGSSYDRIEVGEMLQVALLCTQYLPAHRPKMSEVVRMLEGDGLAEKWAASHNHSNDPSMNLSHPNKSTFCPSTASKHDESGHNRSSSMFGTTMDDDDYEHSLDSYAMELSADEAESEVSSNAENGQNHDLLGLDRSEGNSGGRCRSATKSMAIQHYQRREDERIETVLKDTPQWLKSGVPLDILRCKLRKG
ncbi:unnamed protein product, partial [Dovyalis caffra]